MMNLNNSIEKPVKKHRCIPHNGQYSRVLMSAILSLIRLHLRPAVLAQLQRWREAGHGLEPRSLDDGKRVRVEDVRGRCDASGSLGLLARGGGQLRVRLQVVRKQHRAEASYDLETRVWRQWLRSHHSGRQGCRSCRQGTGTDKTKGLLSARGGHHLLALLSNCWGLKQRVACRGRGCRI